MRQLLKSLRSIFLQVFTLVEQPICNHDEEDEAGIHVVMTEAGFGERYDYDKVKCKKCGNVRIKPEQVVCKHEWEKSPCWCTLVKECFECKCGVFKRVFMDSSGFDL